MVLALLLSITLSNPYIDDLTRISSNLDLEYKVGLNKNKLETSIIEEELKSIERKLNKNTIEEKSMSVIISLYLLSIKQMNEYILNDSIEMYKNSIGNKLYADAMLENLKRQGE